MSKEIKQRIKLDEKSYHLEINLADNIPNDIEMYLDMKLIDKFTDADIYMKHVYMDEYMMKLLAELGYAYGVSAIEHVEKWYG